MTDPTLHQRFQAMPRADSPLVDPSTGLLLQDGKWFRFFVSLWQTLPPADIPGDVRNLTMTRPTATTLHLTADTVITASALNAGVSGIGTSLDLTFDGTLVGPGGMDTGALPAGGFLSLYLILSKAKPPALLGTVASQATIYGGNALPVGYTTSALVGLWPCAAGPSLGQGAQVDRTLLIPANSVLAGGAAVAATLVDLSSAVPLGARQVQGTVANGTAGVITELFADAGGTLGRQDSPAGGRANFSMPLPTSQRLWYLNSAGGGAASINITSFTF